MGRVPPGRGVVDLPGVPAPGAAGDTWLRVDVYRSQRYAVVNAGGAATVVFDALDGNQRWAISRAVVACSGSIDPAPTAQLHIVQGGNSPTELTLASGTTCGLFDEAEYNTDNGLVIFPGEQLQVLWAGAPVGATVVATVQYDLYAQAS